MMSKVELLAPAGSFDSLAAALRAGANAVYFGVGEFNMRSHASVNFDAGDLKHVARLVHAAGAKAYLTLNTVIFNRELTAMKVLCRQALEAGVDAVIASDLAVIACAAQLGLPVHVSVQANIANIEAVRFFARYADAVVLARELTLGEIGEICRMIREEGITGAHGGLLRVEVFAHGALCVAWSGRCYMSLATYQSAANRGRCFQNCRRKFLVRDAESGAELELDNQYVMSPKDLCTVNFLEELLDNGVSILKIEGRGRSADYVGCVTGVYREAIDRIEAGSNLTEADRERYLTQLSTVFNRGFWQGGYYLGESMAMWSGSGGSQAKLRKVFVGKITRYYGKIKVAELQTEAGSISRQDRLLITGKTTGALEVEHPELVYEGEGVEVLGQHRVGTFPLAVKVRANDLVFRLEERKFGDGE